MTDIALEKVIEIADLREFFSAIFPAALVRVEEDWESVSHPLDLVVVSGRNPSEFPFDLDISARLQPERDFEAWLKGVCRLLSIHFRTRSIVSGGPPEIGDNPYRSIIWNKGKPFLANDSGTTLCDGSGGPVRIIRALRLEEISFASLNELSAWVLPHEAW